MRKRGILFPAAACLLAGVLLLFVFGGKRPFRDLDREDIRSASVLLTPPGETVPIPDTERLAELLQKVVTYRRDDSYTDYDGQGVVFSLTMADGARREVMAYAPFVVTDGAGYRTKYEPCQALSAYANALLRGD